MKETSFVYHDKRGFFLLSGQKSRKYGQNRGQIGLRSGIAAVPEPDFCVSGSNLLVYFCLFFTPAKNYEKEDEAELHREAIAPTAAGTAAFVLKLLLGYKQYQDGDAARAYIRQFLAIIERHK